MEAFTVNFLRTRNEVFDQPSRAACSVERKQRNRRDRSNGRRERPLCDVSMRVICQEQRHVSSEQGQSLSSFTSRFDAARHGTSSSLVSFVMSDVKSSSDSRANWKQQRRSKRRCSAGVSTREAADDECLPSHSRDNHFKLVCATRLTPRRFSACRRRRVRRETPVTTHPSRPLQIPFPFLFIRRFPSPSRHSEAKAAKSIAYLPM